MSDKPHFEPKIVAFFCNWCTYTAADLAGISRLTYAPNVRVIRVMCSGRLDPQFVLAAFRHGADGVLIGGCHPGDCHYQEGNYKACRRIAAAASACSRDLGVEDERLRLEWISASEGEKVQRGLQRDDRAATRDSGRCAWNAPSARPREAPPEEVSHA